MPGVPARGDSRWHCPRALQPQPTRDGSNKFGVGLNYSFIPLAAAGETKTCDKKRTRFCFAPRSVILPNLMALCSKAQSPPTLF